MSDIMDKNKENEELKTFTFDVAELFKKYSKKIYEKYKDYNSERTKCPNCGWNTTILIVKAKNNEDALEKVLNGKGLCSECYIKMNDDI